MKMIDVKPFNNDNFQVTPTKAWVSKDVDQTNIDSTPPDLCFSIMLCNSGGFQGYVTLTNTPPKFNPHTGEALEY